MECQTCGGVKRLTYNGYDYLCPACTPENVECQTCVCLGTGLRVTTSPDGREVYHGPGSCPVCDGGGYPNNELPICPDCDGTGRNTFEIEVSCFEQHRADTLTVAEHEHVLRVHVSDTMHCAFCDERIRYDLGTWVDDNLDDCCPGDDEQNNENGDHVPTGFTTHNTNTQGDPT